MEGCKVRLYTNEGDKRERIPGSAEEKINSRKKRWAWKHCIRVYQHNERAICAVAPENVVSVWKRRPFLRVRFV